METRTLKKFSFFFAVLGLICVMLSCKEAEAWLKAYGFTGIRPPSTLLQPGTLIVKKRFEKAGTRVLCSASDSLGANFAPSNSKTITGRFMKSKSIGFKIGAELLDQIHASSSSDAVDSVYVDVKNARVVSLTDSDVLRAVTNRSPECTAAIARRKASGADISMISAAIICDADYKVTFKRDSNLEASVKLQQIQQVAATLGGNVQVLNEDSVSASAIVWGVKDSSYLAAIGINDADVQSIASVAALKRKSILSPGDVLMPAADSNSIAPALTPLSEEKQAYEIDNAPLWCRASDGEDTTDREGNELADTEDAPEVPDLDSIEPQPAEEEHFVRPAGARSPPSFRGRPAVGNGNH